jgi:hypothetical protein
MFLLMRIQYCTKFTDANLAVAGGLLKPVT